MQKPDPVEYEPDIRTVAMETHVLTSGVRYYLQRLKAAFRERRAFIKLPNGDTVTNREFRDSLQTQVREERTAHLRALAAR